jgi:hypothetical protein
MKIYITYSLGLTDLHIASRLARQAQAKGIIVETSQQPATPVNWATAIAHPISNTNVVIAIATRDSQNILNVERDLQIAIKHGKPVLALIEKGLYPQAKIPGIQYIEFDRSSMGLALAQINALLESHKNQQNVNQWLVAGGIALLALYLFGQEK